jgi:hypothetical protein
MALLLPGMPCPLCKQPMDSGQSLFSTWGVWLPKEDPLWRFCDATLHWSCYAAWPDRGRFARSYFEFWVAHEPQNPFWHRVHLDERVYAEVNPDPLVASVWVVLAETGSRISVKLSNWASWLRHTDDGHHEVETSALLAAKGALSAALPSATAVTAAIDLERKRELYERIRAERAETKRRNRAKQAADRARKGQK